MDSGFHKNGVKWVEKQCVFLKVVDLVDTFAISSLQNEVFKKKIFKRFFFFETRKKIAIYHISKKFVF